MLLCLITGIKTEQEKKCIKTKGICQFLELKIRKWFLLGSKKSKILAIDGAAAASTTPGDYFTCNHLLEMSSFRGRMSVQ